MVGGPARWRKPALTALALVTVVVGLAGCAGPDLSGSAADRVNAWVTTGGGGTDIGTLRADIINVDQAAADGQQPAAMRTVCLLLTQDAEAASGSLPTPDQPLTDLLNRAYVQAANAGQACAAAAGGSQSAKAHAAQERAAVPPLLTDAVSRIRTVTGRTPSTPTTSPAGGGDPFAGGGA